MELFQVHPKLPDTSTFIRAEHITVRYGSIIALDSISLQIPSNRVTVLIGPSGCGKSTTLRSFNGMVKPSSGHIMYENTSIQSLDAIKLRRGIGYAIQTVGLMPHLTVEENVDLVPRLLGWKRANRGERVTRMLELVRLDPEVYREKYPNELSGGEAQRVGVARALAADPPVLLMDEPFGAVDPITREQLQDEFIRIQRSLKKTVVFVTHDIDEAIRLADYLVIMKDGKVVQADTPKQILAEPLDEFVERFLGPDRSLKRLSLYTADCFMNQPLSASENSPAVEQDELTSACLWKVDEKGAPVSGSAWVQGRFVERTVTTGHTLHPYSSLKECMSTILSLGLPAAAVVDENGQLCGEIRFETIQQNSLT